MADVRFQWLTTSLDSDKARVGYWGPISDGDTCLALPVAHFSDRTIETDTQGTGSFGSGITIEGTINPGQDRSGLPERFKTLNDPQGDPLAGITTEKPETILEGCYLLRPRALTGVSGIYVWLKLAGPR